MTISTVSYPNLKNLLDQAKQERAQRQPTQAELARRAKSVERDDKGIEYTFRGANLKLQTHDAHEVIIAGAAETGKTVAALYKLNRLAWTYPGSQWAIIRKVRHDMDGSVLQTFRDRILGENSPVTIYGGNRPEWFDYPNGARIWVGGIDRPSGALSSERDGMYVNQSEELDLDDWETLTTRTTGRAGHVVINGRNWSQVFGDCNPGAPGHWIKHRASLALLESRHEDNPSLYDDAGALTERGKVTMSVLDALTGVRKERLRYGRWAQTEGAIYEDYSAAIHLIDRFDIPGTWRRFRVIDFGLVNPFVCQWWAIDGDGRMYRYREIYMTGRTVSTHAEQIVLLSANEQIEQTICDHDAEDRQTLEENGIPNIAANKAVLIGIGKVQDRLKLQINKQPRIFFLRDSLVETDQTLADKRKPICTEQEIETYVWKSKATKDEPVKESDHGMDATRYAVMYADGGGVSILFEA